MEATRSEGPFPMGHRGWDECPRCGGSLGEPVSDDVHCYVACDECGARFELDDPELAERRPRETLSD
jgi:hypothetical protein